MGAEEMLADSLLEAAQCVSVPWFPTFEKAIEIFEHIGGKGVGKNAASAECARSPLHGAVKPSDEQPTAKRVDSHRDGVRIAHPVVAKLAVIERLFDLFWLV